MESNNHNDWNDWVEIKQKQTDSGFIVYKNIKTGEKRSFLPVTKSASTADIYPANIPFFQIKKIDLYPDRCTYCGRKIKQDDEICRGCGANV